MVNTRCYFGVPNSLVVSPDSGAMGSYVAFQLMGLYPLPATRQFLIYTPHFSRVTIRNPYLKTTTTIRTYGYGEAENFGVGDGLYIEVSCSESHFN